jgi:rRNA-processing protein FCF1
MPDPRSPLLIDANVLIDFRDSDLTALTLVARHLRPVRVLQPVLREVDELGETECDRHGLKLWEPSPEQLEAAAKRRRSLSFLDHAVLIVARDEGWVCATNDQALRQECEVEGVPTRWGLELLAELVEADQLSAEVAFSIASEIHDNNKYHITRTILRRFERRLRTSKK